MEKRTALTYIDSDGNWHRSSKGAPEQVHHDIKKTYKLVQNFFPLLIYILILCIILVLQILALCNARVDLQKKVHAIIDKFAERGLRSLAVARQVL